MLVILYDMIEEHQSFQMHHSTLTEIAMIEKYTNLTNSPVQADE